MYVSYYKTQDNKKMATCVSVDLFPDFDNGCTYHI